jgi:hypothetical protein
MVNASSNACVGVLAVVPHRARAIHRPDFVGEFQGHFMILAALDHCHVRAIRLDALQFEHAALRVIGATALACLGGHEREKPLDAVEQIFPQLHFRRRMKQKPRGGKRGLFTTRRGRHKSGARNLFRFGVRPRLRHEIVFTFPNARALKRNKFRAPKSSRRARILKESNAEFFKIDEISTRGNDGPRSPEAIMRDVNRAFEAAARRDPAKWFWVHNRSKPVKVSSQKSEVSIQELTKREDGG